MYYVLSEKNVVKVLVYNILRAQVQTRKKYGNFSVSFFWHSFSSAFAVAVCLAVHLFHCCLQHFSLANVKKSYAIDFKKIAYLNLQADKRVR